MSKENKSSADLRSEPHDPTYFYRELKVESKWKCDTIFKFLLSKLLCTEAPFLEADEVMLFLSREELIGKMAVHPELYQKYLMLVTLTKDVFINLGGISQNYKERLLQGARVRLYFKRANKKEFLSAHSYYGGKIKFHISLQSSIPRKHKDKCRIGVGYRDKGTARNSAWDGSPSWQEVATDEWFQSHSEQRSTPSEKIDQIYSNLRNLGKDLIWWINSTKPRSKGLCSQMRG